MIQTPPLSMSAFEDPASATDGHAAHASVSVPSNMDTSVSPAKRKVEIAEDENNAESKRRKGTAPIKAEYLLASDHRQDHVLEVPVQEGADDDAAEAYHHKDRSIATGNSKHKRREKNQGQNKARKFGTSRDEVQLCSTRTRHSEFSPKQCPFGEKCRYEHDIRNYLKHKREDLATFNAGCPVFEVKGKCPVGWKCRFVGSHSKEIEHEDGRKELVLLGEDGADGQSLEKAAGDDVETGVANALSADQRISLTKKNFPTPKSEAYLQYVNTLREPENSNGASKPQRNSSSPEPEHESNGQHQDKHDNAAGYVEPPFRPSEKRRLYFGPETPILAPLTTQGNLPFRRLCTSLGATFNYSEMAMSMPLLQGQKSEWALLKAHESEVQPPTFSTKNIVYDYGYDQSQDMHFGAQIAANKPWLACKATEILTTLLPRGLRCVDLNVGCPIDLVYREGAGSALMDSSHKLEKMLRGMNYVSNATPITVKIRTGTKDKSPTAQKLVERLVLGGGASSRSTLSPDDPQASPCGVAAITLHGRSRQQRYTRSADWDYITSTASLIKNLNSKRATLQDTIHEPDARDLPNTSPTRAGKVFFIGNGDVFSPVHYQEHLNSAHVDGVMVARGALIKPWLFEEIASNQHLDKSSSERLRYIEAFCRYGLEAWGSDEVGVGQTRRFLLEWLSFACRYVPVGLLEVMPPNIQDRPPRYRGRDELETLMASDNYKDWIKISEMFLGKAAEGFRFEPKHRSNAYDTQAEG
jgi:tRNA-dihydrouridine synthase 3